MNARCKPTDTNGNCNADNAYAPMNPNLFNNTSANAKIAFVNTAPNGCKIKIAKNAVINNEHHGVKIISNVSGTQLRNQRST